MAETRLPDVTGPAFETALKQLEEIVTKLERGDVPLEESIAIYERGEALKKRCESLLSAGRGAGREDPRVGRARRSASSLSTRISPVQTALIDIRERFARSRSTDDLAMSTMEHTFERILFAMRWLLAPLYLGPWPDPRPLRDPALPELIHIFATRPHHCSRSI